MDKGKPCSSLFSQDHYQAIQDQCVSLTRDELDLVILGQIMANIYLEDTVGERTRHAIVQRQRSRMAFFHHGRKICRATFLKLHGIGKLMSQR